MKEISGSRFSMACNTSWGIVNFRGNLIRQLKSAGAEVITFSPEDGHSKILSQAADSWTPVKVDGRGANPVSDYWTMRSFQRFYKESRPDLALHYTIKPVIYGTMAARRAGIPVLNVVTGLGSAFIKENWLTLAAKCLYRSALRGAEPVAFLNQDDREFFAENRIVPTSSSVLLPGEGIDLERFKAEPLPGKQKGQCRFLYAGRLLKDKGLRELVAAFKSMARPGVELTILGIKDRTNPSALDDSEISSWKDVEGLTLIPATDDVRPFIRDHHVLVLPSYREGLPRIILEAMAMERPVLATDVVGCRDLVEEGQNGWLCRPRDADDLAAKMALAVAEGAADMQSKGARGRTLVAERYSDEAVWEVYEKLILEKLNYGA